MEALYQKKTQVSAAVSDDTYKQVLKEAARRGVTVSELVRYFVEEGLSNPTAQELRRHGDRLMIIEAALKELYEMAVVNLVESGEREGDRRAISGFAVAYRRLEQVERGAEKAWAGRRKDRENRIREAVRGTGL